jgi:hypothetical protein
MERNSCRSPWQTRMDFSVRQTLPEVRGHRFTAQLDIFNFLNLLNNEWGQIRLPTASNTFPQQNLFNISGRTAGPLNTSQANYTLNGTFFNADGTPRPFIVPANNSAQLYQMQLSFRYSF